MHFNVLMYFCRSADLPEHAFKVAMKELKVGIIYWNRPFSKNTIILFVVLPKFYIIKHCCEFLLGAIVSPKRN